MFFFLSGYGNYLALGRLGSRREVIRRTVSQVSRLVIIYLMCFVATGIIRFLLVDILHNKGIVAAPVTAKEVLSALLTLRMPETTTWYLKVQLLYYGIAALAFTFTSKHRNALIWLGGILYVAVAAGCNLPDFWWKTAICFPVGALCARYREKCTSLIGRRKVSFLLGSLAMVSLAYLWILKDWKYRVIPQLAAYAVIATGIVIVCSVLQLEAGSLRMAGRASLVVYLVHVGLAPALLSGQGDGNIQIMVYIVLTALVSFLIRKGELRIFRIRTVWGHRTAGR